MKQMLFLRFDASEAGLAQKKVKIRK